jgi:hypothetical protein
MYILGFSPIYWLVKYIEYTIINSYTLEDT